MLRVKTRALTALKPVIDQLSHSLAGVRTRCEMNYAQIAHLELADAPAGLSFIG